MSLSWDFLGLLEEREARLLAWGVVDGAFTPDEVEVLADAFVSARNIEADPRELVSELIDQRLLVRFRVEGRDVVRTRMAETVRLLARLRQIFPRRSWRAAPTLVADYRFTLRPRRYPRRDVPLAKLFTAIAGEGMAVSGIQRAAIRALATRDGEEKRLAGFQLRATIRMLRNLRDRRSTGMIVGAGTGTGKTLAFYLPALSHIAGTIRRHDHWARAIAVYPRRELLKDQFSETFVQARQLDRPLATAGARKVLIGAYFSLTPNDASERELQEKWKRQGDMFLCPFLRCPRCEGTLGWRRSDVQNRRERLWCTEAGCDGSVQPDEVVLTRRRMERDTPDVLFTTTETLNMRMSDARVRHVFGVGADRPPRIVLLDEVHTYAGVHGAQVAYVLRRWRRAIGNHPVHFTGLSATLPNAAEFFAQLVGLRPDVVEPVEPFRHEMDAEGMEYQIALRGDPASGTALLSATIQSAMLLRRTLDVGPEVPSGGAAGSRLFVFADDLDVANRLYHNLLDAEGLVALDRPKRAGEPLAALRAHRALATHGEADPGERLLAGQSWYLAEQIGHNLSRPLRIGRTTSQDTGVDQNLDVVVATASLEVGYDDSAVGVVIQHKAPREVAAFLQRKGRAGRDRRMRPWTLVVLSDYGRDRGAYQAYDQLFDPLVETRTLPIGNRHVLRMQAAFAFMDWVALRASPRVPAGSLWKDFSAPAAGSDRDGHRRQGWEASLIRELLEDTDSDAQRSLESYLSSALQITADEVRAVLWEPPRALLTSVLPTLLRRLEHGWGTGRDAPAGASSREPYRSYHPLPEFVPENLFSDLNLPEVAVETPPPWPGERPGSWTMPVVQAMRTLAPGRVTRRFSPFRANVSHWVAPPELASGEQPLSVDHFCPEFEELGPVQIATPEGISELPCYRPWLVRAGEIPQEVATTSNAVLLWRSQLSPSDEGMALDLPPGGGWDELLTEVRFFVHALRSHVQVRRFALGADAGIRFRTGGEVDPQVRFVGTDGCGPAAVGFVQQSDGIVFRFRMPPGYRLRTDDPDQEKGRAFRTSYFRHCVMADAALAARANDFERERLAEVYLSALSERSVREAMERAEATDCVRNAADTLRAEGLATHLGRVLDIIFQTMSTDQAATEDTQAVVLAVEGSDDDAEEEDDPSGTDRKGSPAGRQRTHRALAALCADPVVEDALARNAAVLWEDPDEQWDAWAEQRFRATLGGALLEACYRLCPQAGEGDLLLDLDAGPRPPDAPAAPEDGEIWITEATIGGGGLVEELLRRYAEDPRRFFLLARSSLGPSDFETVDTELARLLELLADDGTLQSAVAGVRSAESHQELESAVDSFRNLLVARGILAIHPVMSSVHARVLRPASSPATDALLLELSRRWREQEERLGIEIDPRVFAYVASTTPLLDQALSHIDSTRLRDPLWRFDVVYGLLWPRGSAVRARALGSYNPFAALPDADRALLLDVLQGREAHVRLGEDGWRERLGHALATAGAAHLHADPAAHAELKTVVLDLVGSPLDVDFLHLYPQVEGVERSQSATTVRLHIREVVL